MTPDELIWHAVGTAVQEPGYRRARSNMLLVGSAPRVEALIEAATGVPSTALPTWPGGLTASGTTGPGTILVPNVQLLSQQQQVELHRTIADWHGTVRIVATAPAPLYPLVLRGAFHEGLYYRLNMLCVQEPAIGDALD